MSLYKKIYDLFCEEYLMYAMIGVLISSCLGAGASMLVLHQGHGFAEMFQVALLVTVCMGFNATILSDRKRKLIFNWLIASVITSLVILLIHLI